jgi:hypothetical protein
VVAGQLSHDHALIAREVKNATADPPHLLGGEIGAQRLVCRS